MLAILLVPAAAGAQGLTSREARPTDIETLDGIVEAFYDVISTPAGGEVDWARDSTLYVEGVRFTILGRAEDGGWRARRIDHGTYAAESDGFLSSGFFEREVHREAHRFGPMVQLFSTYEWGRIPGGAVEGRGINSMELFHDGDRWWIVSVMWTSEDPENPIPEGFLPGGG